MTEPSNVRQNLVLLICLLMLGYFGFHAVEGKHGLEARAGLLKQAHELDLKLARLEAERARLSRNVDLLASDRIDPDMLAEQARRLLVMTHRDDVVILPKSRRLNSRRAKAVLTQPKP